MEIEHLEKIINEHPTSPLFTRLASEYLNQGRVEDAITVCQVGLQHYPKYSTALLILARCFESKTVYTSALENLKRAIELNPDSPLLKAIAERLENSILTNNQVEQNTHDETSEITVNENETLSTEVIESIGEETLSTEEPHGSLQTNTQQELTPVQEVQPKENTPEYEQPEIKITSISETTQNIESNEPQVVLIQEDNLSQDIENITTSDENPIVDETTIDVQDDRIERVTVDNKEDIKENVLTDESIIANEKSPQSELADIIVSRTLAEIYISQGAYEEALQTYRILLKQKPEQRETIEKRIQELEEIIKNKLSEDKI